MVNDPVHDMIYDAITKPYHDPEFATAKMLPNKVTQYIPAPDSKQTILDFNFADKNEISWEMVFNPLQLSLKPKCIFWTKIYEGRDTEVDTGETYEITGVWTTDMVGPLKGKPYSKTVPVVTLPYKLNFFYATYDSDFYPYWFKGAKEYDALFYTNLMRNAGNDYDFTTDNQAPRFKLRMIVEKSYGTFHKRNDYKKRQRGRAIFTEATRLMMKEYGLEDPIYYVYNANASTKLKAIPPNIKPINYNPPSYTLADFFMGLEWGECVFEEPPSDLEPAVRETMLSIQSELREKMRDWVDNEVGNTFYYDTDEDGRNWNIPNDWALEMMADLGDQNILPQFVDMVLGWHFSYLDLDDPLNVYLLENKSALEKFRDSGWLRYQCQIDLGIRDDLDDWLSELLDDYYD